MYEATLITSQIHLGGYDGDLCAMRAYLKTHGIQSVLTVWEDAALPGLVADPANHMLVRCHDSPLVHIEHHFEETYRFIRQRVEVEGQRLLVHCYAGRSRSATILLYYLMRRYRWTYDEAFAAVSARRPIAPNDAFVRKLKQYAH